MTPPDHLMAGLSIGTVYAALCGLFSLKRLAYPLVIFLCGVFALLPDADAFRGIYSSTDPFIGHRGITHSLFFVISAAVIFTLMFALARWRSEPCQKINHFDKYNYIWIDLFILLFFSGVSHLVMDLPQPPGIWKGIPLFFPLKNGDVFARSGGWGNIGWYDYRVTWILFISLLVSLILLSASVLFRKNMYAVKLFSICIIIIITTAGGYIADKISNSAFKGSREWNDSQRLYIDGFHPYIKRITVRGRQWILGFIN